jgi:putative peptide zinc metalloprotease protein
VAGSFLSASWYRVADLRPQLRSHAHVHRQRFRGKAWYVLRDSASGKLHRFSPGAYQVLQLMDGRRSIDGIWQEVAAATGVDAPTQDEVIELLSKLHAGDLLQTDLPPDVAELTERGAKQKRQKRLQSFINPMSIRIPLWDPDPFLNRTWPAVAWLFGPVGIILWLLALVPALVIGAMHWNELTGSLSDRVLTADNLVMLLVVYPAIKLLHEMGHAYAVKSGDGEVHEMGVMLLVLAPIPYVDATASGAFRSKWRRAFVGAAGMMVELFLASLAVVVWVLVEPGLVRSAAYNVIFVAGMSTLVFNGNPLLRYDAYYILADLIEIPNLAQRANQYWQWLAKRHLFGARELERPQGTPGERRWFLFYGPASFVYRSFVMIAISLFIAGEFFFIGVVLAIWGAITMFVLPLAKGLKYVLSNGEIQRQRHRAMLVTFGGLALFLLFAFVVPMPLRTHAQGVVWVPENAEVRARGNGFVERLMVAPDAWVKEGDVLLVTRDPALDADAVQRGERVRQLEVQYASQMFEERLQAAVVAEDLARERVGLARTEERLGDLLLTAGVSGRLRLPRADDLPDRYVKKGELLGYVLAAPPRVVRAVVSQDDIALVRNHLAGVEVKIADRLAETWTARLIREVPGGQDQLPSKALSLEGGGIHGTDPRDPDGLRSLERLFQFDLELPEGVGELQLGTRVHVRFRHEPEPLASQWGRRLRQLFLSRFHV